MKIPPNITALVTVHIVQDEIHDGEPLERRLAGAATKIIHEEVCDEIKLGIKVQSVAHDAYMRALSNVNIDKA